MELASEAWADKIGAAESALGGRVDGITGAADFGGGLTTGVGLGRGSSLGFGFGFGSVFGLGLDSGFGSGLEGTRATGALTGNGGRSGSATSGAIASAAAGRASDADGVPDAPGAAAAADGAGPDRISVTVTGNGFGGVGGGSTTNASNKPATLRCASTDKPAIAVCWLKVGRMIAAALRVSWIR